MCLCFFFFSQLYHFKTFYFTGRDIIASSAPDDWMCWGRSPEAQNHLGGCSGAGTRPPAMESISGFDWLYA